MRYVTYDASGKLTGCFQQPVHPMHANSHIQVAREVAMVWTRYQANAARDGVEPAPPVEPSMSAHNAPILDALARIDAKSIRPLREGDVVRVADLEAQAAALRAQLRKE